MTALRPHALVFPGQGSQHAGMLERLPASPDLSRLLDAAEALANLPLRSTLTAGDATAIADTRLAQPLLYLADWTWGRSLLDAGLLPVAVAGHSLGELAALAVAGVVSVEAGLELVTERARLMADCAASAPGAMAAVLGSDASLIADLLADITGVWVANDNAPGQVIISGTHRGIEAATASLDAAGVRKIVPLKVAGPFHTPLMARAAESFATLVAGASMSDARIPIIQNTEPAPASDADTIRRRLITQIVSPVRWTETMSALASAGADVLVEAGPGAVLTGLSRRSGVVTGVAVEDAGIPGVLEVLAA